MSTFCLLGFKTTNRKVTQIIATSYRKQEIVQKNTAAAQINNSKYKKLLGVKVNSKLTFNDYIENISKKVCKKLSSLTRDAQ